MKPVHIAALLLLGAIWGASFLFIGIAVGEFGPLCLMFLRVAIAGLVLVLFAALRQRRHGSNIKLDLRSKWPQYLTLGLLNSALPFTLIAFSELSIPVALAAILNSTTPLFTALVATAWGYEALTGRKVWGALLGMIGVTVLVGGSPAAVNAELIIAILASLLAACCYGAGTVYASKHISGLPAAYASIIQLLSAAFILAVPAALTVPPELPSSSAMLALLALTLLSTTCAYLLYFFLLQHVGPTRTASVTFIVPVFGSLWGIMFLHESFSALMLVGMATILISVGLVMDVQIDKRKRGTPFNISSASDV
jgi:drug/metabolite transporter (DMT)-like permease